MTSLAPSRLSKLSNATNPSKIPVKSRKSHIPVRSKGVLTCKHHDNKEVTLVCEDCEGELACVECVTSVHQRHGLVKLDDVAPLKRENVHSFVEKAENNAIPKVKKQLRLVNEQISDNKTNFEDLTSKITKQSEAIKNEIDKIVDRFLTTCKEAEDFNHKKLSKYRKTLTGIFADLNLQVHECKQVLKLGSVQQLHLMEKKIKRGIKMPAAPKTKGMFFSPSTMELEKLEQALGLLNAPDEDSEDEEHTYSSTVKDFNDAASGVFNADDFSGILTMPQQTSRSIAQVSEFKHSTDIHSMCAADHSQVWILDIFSYEIFLLTRQGAVKQTLDIKVCPDDLSISPINGHMWLSSEDDYKIREIGTTADKLPKVRFHSTDLPLCLCVSRDNKIMVGTHKTITIFTPDGEVVQRSTTDRTRRQLVTFPRHIAQCQLSGNIAVADGDDPEWGGDDKPHIVVMDSNLQLKFRYRGEITASASTKRRNMANFDPYDMCFDSNGSILIADRTNRSVTLINHDGRFIGRVLADQDRPVALALKNDLLWVGFDRGKVKLLKYMVN